MYYYLTYNKGSKAKPSGFGVFSGRCHGIVSDVHPFVLKRAYEVEKETEDYKEFLLISGFQEITEEDFDHFPGLRYLAEYRNIQDVYLMREKTTNPNPFIREK